MPDGKKGRTVVLGLSRWDGVHTQLRVVPQIELVDNEVVRQQWAALKKWSLPFSFARNVINFADAWGRMMQVKMSSGATVAEAAQATQQAAGRNIVTDDECVAAIRMLASCWIHGVDLRRWHNARYLSSDEFRGAEAQGSTFNPKWTSFGPDIKP